MMTKSKISISIDPTDMETGPNDGDVLDEAAYLSAIREAIEDRWPNARIICLQVGYSQGDGWYRLDGADSDEVRECVSAIDTSDEALYPATD